MPTPNRITRLLVALAVASAIALPCAAVAEEAQLDKMRAKVSAFISNMMEKQGGSRIVYKVDAGALRESVVTELRDDAYKNLREPP